MPIRVPRGYLSLALSESQPPTKMKLALSAELLIICEKSQKRERAAGFGITGQLPFH